MRAHPRHQRLTPSSWQVPLQRGVASGASALLPCSAGHTTSRDQPETKKLTFGEIVAFAPVQPQGEQDHMSRPLYLRLRDQIVGWILAGRYPDGDILPSVRSLAAETGANPLTVAKAYQTLAQVDVIRSRHGIGFFVLEGGAERLRKLERSRFLADQWPHITAEMRRLELTSSDLCVGAGHISS